MGTSLEAILVTYVLPIHSPKAGGSIFNRGWCFQCALPWLKPMLTPTHAMLILHVC